jgi:hypothetical protein
MAVDGLGNVFVANGVRVGEMGDYVPGSGISEFTGTGTPLSPTNYPAPSSETSSCSGVGAGMPAFGFNQFETFSGVGTNLTIDSSGNLWPGAAALVHMVGLAAPVATPTYNAISLGSTLVSAFSISTSTCGPSTPTNPYYTITFTTPNNFKPPQSISAGQFVELDFPIDPGGFLNTQLVEVLTATSTQFTACINVPVTQTMAQGQEGNSYTAPSGDNVTYSHLGNRP